MKQLDEIVELAASDEARLATILRKCLVVASRLKNDNLRDWATAELNGYDDNHQLPDYRVAGITARGFFVGPMGLRLNNQPLPSINLKEDLRWWASTAYLKEGVSAYETMLSGDKPPRHASVPWPANLVVLYQTKFFEGYVLNRAWQEIPIGVIVGVVDTVRTRLLQLALELQGEIGEDDRSIPPPEVVERSVQTIIFGGNNVLGPVTGDVQLIGQQLVVQGDLESLKSALKAIGVDDGGIKELGEAIEADSADGADKGFGKRVGGWLQKAGTYVGKEGVKVGVEVAQKAATQAVLTYFGLAS